MPELSLDRPTGRPLISIWMSSMVPITDDGFLALRCSGSLKNVDPWLLAATSLFLSLSFIFRRLPKRSISSVDVNANSRGRVTDTAAQSDSLRSWRLISLSSLAPDV